jgi:NADH:ubiquinone oxidoreductase subunit 4 (subunit M)
MILDLQNILIYLLILPLIGILSLLFLPSWNDILIKKISLIFSGISLVLSIFLLIFFNFSQSKFQFYFKYNWVPNFNFNFILGIDGISLFFILLTNLLIFLCVLISWNSIKHNLKLYFIMFFILNFFLIGVFCVLDLLLFYIFF